MASHRSINYHTRMVPSIRDRIAKLPPPDHHHLTDGGMMIELMRDTLAMDDDLLSDAAKVAICKRILEVSGFWKSK